MLFPYLKTDNEYVNKAYRLAVSTVFCNIIPYYQKQCGDIVLAAGLEYPAPWTRDASINTWNICGLLCPPVTETTLLSVLNEDYVIGGYAGQNWDNIIWAIGAWYQYLYTGNIDFLNIAYRAVTTTLKEFEESEFNDKENLFIGPACYGDGVSAYDDKYAVHGSGAIAEYPLFNTMKLYTLPTNCLFYEAYVIADKMADVLGTENLFAKNASKLKNAINRRFWSEERGMYYYYIDESGTNNSMEALGNSFAILFGIANDRQKNLIFKINTLQITEFHAYGLHLRDMQNSVKIVSAGIPEPCGRLYRFFGLMQLAKINKYLYSTANLLSKPKMQSVRHNSVKFIIL